ncbi:MAG: hypothetical protein PVH31_09670 [Ectothiorhodospiraceae bacterium]|jgi:hypothetical protein
MEAVDFRTLPVRLRDADAACRAARLFPRHIVTDTNGSVCAVETTGRRVLVGHPGAYFVVPFETIDEVASRDHGDWIELSVRVCLPASVWISLPWRSGKRARVAHYTLCGALLEARAPTPLPSPQPPR